MNETHNPDVLSCLANLSNDEVFTPPSVVNQMLDMLPQELFWSSKTTFLDIGCKSGVFLREITKRLITGLAGEIPDLQTRVDHILHEQVFGIATTELTSLVSRRTLYCSKYPNCRYSTSQFKTVEGNIRFRNIPHTFVNGRCKWCGASEEQFGDAKRKGLETHAYEFIHTDHPEEIFKMKFDVIVGNPPYQIEDGGFGDSARPIYHEFVRKAKKLSPRFLTMIIPARWYSGGKGLDEFRNEMLGDRRIRIIHDFPETSECFPGVNIRGGVCYFLWNRDELGDCKVCNHQSGNITSTMNRPLLEMGAETFIRYNKAIGILHKVQGFNEKTFSTVVSSRKPFGLATNFSDYTLKACGKNVVPIYRNGGIGYTSRTNITKGDEYFDKIKVLVSKASPGSDEYPHLVFSEPIIADRGEACTETYLVVNVVKSQKQGRNLKAYMATKFFRFLVLLIKNTQDLPRRVYSFVPMQNMDEVWDDKRLYKKYEISKEEIAFIDSVVKDVEWN